MAHFGISRILMPPEIFNSYMFKILQAQRLEPENKPTASQLRYMTQNILLVKLQ